MDDMAIKANNMFGNPQETVLPFGKYKGQKLSKVPLKMIGWLLVTYSGNQIPKEAIETEAIKRGCEKRNGRWGIERPRNVADPISQMGDGDIHVDFLGNAISCTLRDDESADWGDDMYDYEGIPNC